MAQFDMYTSFLYDGVSSDIYSLKIYSLDNSFNKTFGLQRDVDTTEVNGRNIFKGIKNKSITIPLILAKTDADDRPLVITDNEEIEIKRWLFKQTPRAFSPVGSHKNYIGIFSAKEDSWFNAQNKGYISLDFIITSDGTSYDTVNTKSLYMYNNTVNLELDNMCDINERTYMDIFITYYGGNGTIELTNKTDGSYMKISDLKVNNNYSIWTGRRIAINNTDNKDIMYGKISNIHKGFTLAYGTNQVEVKCTNCECEIRLEFQPKMSL